MIKLPSKKYIFIGGLTLTVGFVLFSLYEAFYFVPRFRTMQDKIASTEQVDLTGLREIQASGGSAPHLPELQKSLSYIKKPKLIIDAKSESHAYIAGVPASFFRYGLPRPRLRHLLRRAYYTGTIYERPELTTQESDQAKQYGFDYIAVNIGSRFTAPDQDIDTIVALLESLPQDTWVHVHCRNGAGRTTMLLTMLDIMKNAPTVALNDIVKRQYLVGLVDLFDTTVWAGGSYKQEQLNRRKKFIEDFYAFICQRKAGGIQLWSEWNHKNRQGQDT